MFILKSGPFPGEAALRGSRVADRIAGRQFDACVGPPLREINLQGILDPLAVKLLDGEFKPGDAVKVNANGDDLTFKLK